MRKKLLRQIDCRYQGQNRKTTSHTERLKRTIFLSLAALVVGCNGTLLLTRDRIESYVESRSNWEDIQVAALDLIDKKEDGLVDIDEIPDAIRKVSVKVIMHKDNSCRSVADCISKNLPRMHNALINSTDKYSSFFYQIRCTSKSKCNKIFLFSVSNIFNKL